MTPIARRTLLSLAALAVPLPMIAACSLTAPGATPLEQAKAYADDLANAVSAAAAAYIAGPPKPTAANAALVNQLVDDLQKARAALDATTATTDARSIAQQVIAGVQQLAPMVTVFLGSAAPYVPLAIAVVQSFINAIPAPPNAPAMPPAALRRAGMAYSPHARA
jgi:hypothetical protein